jgi:hypothetical protein
VVDRKVADEELAALIRVECAERRESDEFLANAMRKQDDVRPICVQK